MRDGCVEVRQDGELFSGYLERELGQCEVVDEERAAPVDDEVEI